MSVCSESRGSQPELETLGGSRSSLDHGSETESDTLSESRAEGLRLVFVHQIKYEKPDPDVVGFVSLTRIRIRIKMV
jgi:hypothetical protein